MIRPGKNARVHGFVIVTIDHDFIRLFETRGAPPAVIVRHQNMPWRFYGDLIKNEFAEIEKAIVNENLDLVEIH